MQGEEHVPNPPKVRLSTCPSGTRNSIHHPPQNVSLYRVAATWSPLWPPTRERPAVCWKRTHPRPTTAPHLGQCDGSPASPAGRRRNSAPWKGKSFLSLALLQEGLQPQGLRDVFVHRAHVVPGTARSPSSTPPRKGRAQGYLFSPAGGGQEQR